MKNHNIRWIKTPTIICELCGYYIVDSLADICDYVHDDCCEKYIRCIGCPVKTLSVCTCTKIEYNKLIVQLQHDLNYELQEKLTIMEKYNHLKCLVNKNTPYTV